MKRKLSLIGVFLCGLVIVGCFSMKLFWPTAWIVNAPMVQFLTGWGGGSQEDSVLNSRVKLPAGFTINTYAKNLGHTRALLLLNNGDLLVSSSREGIVYRLLFDQNQDGRADGTTPILKGLNYPFGLAYADGYLYVGETDSVIRVPYDVNSGSIDYSKLQRIVTGLPGGGNHYTRTVKIGPDNKLYVTIGSSCNVCIEKDARRASMMRYNLDGSGEEFFATGLRNTVGFVWSPIDGAIYGVENGRDFLGDDTPPDELNRIVESGFYGWPYRYGDNVKDPAFAGYKDPRIDHARGPVHQFGAHTAPLGIVFLTAANTPKEFKNAALVTQHGSWNRSKKSGYQVVALHWERDGSILEKPFLTGLMINERVFGRPVDIIQAPDGTLFISDDFTSSVYRVTTK